MTDIPSHMQVWEFTGSRADEVVDQLVRAAHRSLLNKHVQACMNIIRCLEPFALSLDPTSGEPANKIPSSAALPCDCLIGDSRAASNVNN